MDIVYSEEDSSCNMLTGYTVGLNVGYPVIADEWISNSTGPSLGIVMGTPHGFDLGPYAVGVGGGIDLANVGGDADYTGIYLSLSSTVYETPSGPLSVYANLGYYMGNEEGNISFSGNGLGVSGSMTFDYAVPDQPVVIQPYVSGTLLLNPSDGGGQATWLNIGAMIHYVF